MVVTSLPSAFISSTSASLSKHTGRRILFILLGCIMTACLVVLMIYTYTVLNRRGGGGGNVGGFSRFRRKFHLFHISPNRDENESRLHLPENQDEALLYDDPYNNMPYTDHNSNPYKSLTLAVT
ncbi:unnamed protein product [Didymodactylos carnosus]|uniref:Uncharacterized protein n=1 Tax=Didymodactylos carnosus TaxID=1234261 RepID=A0A8S2CWF7_9BILA|nr:unnamed protein product [Didymodactylos carnosus]CAF3605258.1 unnamed protein product [Didymodactylos carnosus]